LSSLELIQKNPYLKELTGKTLSNKLKADAKKYMKEQQLKFFNGFIPQAKETAYIFCSDKEGRIKGVGASCVDDIFNDNIAKWWSAHLRAPTTGITDPDIVLIDTGGTNRNVRIYNVANMFNSHISQTRGSYFQLGSGTTAPARDDNGIETALGTAPESTVFGTGAGVYSAGQITASNSIVAGGSGTVAESVWIHRFVVNTAVSSNFCWAHDAISPTVGFTPSDTLTCEYTVNL
jgi:hypothetical protein